MFASSMAETLSREKNKVEASDFAQVPGRAFPINPPRAIVAIRTEWIELSFCIAHSNTLEKSAMLIFTFLPEYEDEEY